MIEVGIVAAKVAKIAKKRRKQKQIGSPRGLLRDIHDDISLRRRVGGPGLQDVVGGTFGVMYSVEGLRFLAFCALFRG